MTGDRVIRLATAAVVCAVAAFAAVVSYSHIYGLGRAHGQDGTAARLLPLSVDGLILAASLVLLLEARNGRDVPRLARFMLWLGIAATIGANIAYGAGYGLLGALISAWPAMAFIGAVEIAMQQVRRARVPRAGTSGPVVPEVPGDVGQAVRAAYAASVAAGQPLSQRAMAERFGLSRRKVSQLITTIAVDGNGQLPDATKAEQEPARRGSRAAPGTMASRTGRGDQRSRQLPDHPRRRNSPPDLTGELAGKNLRGGLRLAGAVSRHQQIVTTRGACIPVVATGRPGQRSGIPGYAGAPSPPVVTREDQGNGEPTGDDHRRAIARRGRRR